MCVEAFQKTLASACRPFYVGSMRNESSRASIEALKNMLSEVDLILSTTDPLPENRTARCRELLDSSIALADDLAYQGREKPAVALGHKGGSATSRLRGTEHYRMMAASRKVHGGGRPRKRAKSPA
jgi:hypothetical protein